MEENLRTRLIPVLNRSNTVIQLVLEQRMHASPVDLTIKQFVLLNRVQEQERPQSELAMVTNRDKGSLTRLIQSLERKKFVTRRVCETDSRMNLVKITPLGRKVMAVADEVVIQSLDELTVDLSEKEQLTMIKASKKLMARASQLLDALHNQKTL